MNNIVIFSILSGKVQFAYQMIVNECKIDRSAFSYLSSNQTKELSDKGNNLSRCTFIKLVSP